MRKEKLFGVLEKPFSRYSPPYESLVPLLRFSFFSLCPYYNVFGLADVFEAEADDCAASNFFLRFTRTKKMNTHPFRGQVSRETRRKDRKFAKVLLKSSSCFIKTWRKVSLGNFILGGKWNRAKYFYLPLVHVQVILRNRCLDIADQPCNRISKVTFIKKPLFRM